MNNGQFYNGGFSSGEIFFRKEEERNNIKRLGFYIGLALTLFIFIQYVLVFLMSVLGISDDYGNNPVIQSGLGIVISVIDILIPFLTVGSIMKKKTGIKDIAPITKGRDKKLFILSIPAGLGLCMVANIITSFLVAFLNLFGIVLNSPEISRPGGLSGFLLSVLQTSVVAAIVEEIAMRGCVMQPLRKHGDTFAIVASACAFGLMHGNLVQAPFAIIVGIGLGYIAVKTDTITSAIIVHALNNFISTFITYLSESEAVNETAVAVLYTFIVYGLIFIGAISLVLFKIRERKVCPAVRPISYLSGFEKAVAFIKSPTMIFAIIMLFVTTASFVEIKWF